MEQPTLTAAELAEIKALEPLTIEDINEGLQSFFDKEIGLTFTENGTIAPLQRKVTKINDKGEVTSEYIHHGAWATTEDLIDSWNNFVKRFYSCILNNLDYAKSVTINGKNYELKPNRVYTNHNRWFFRAVNINALAKATRFK